MKPLSQRKKSELEELHAYFELDLPEGKTTNPELILNLKNNGVTNAKLKAFEEKMNNEHRAPDTVISGMTVVCMDRNNASFKFDKYTFTPLMKYVLMPREIADELLAQHEGFRKASGTEVENYYK